MQAHVGGNWVNSGNEPYSTRGNRQFRQRRGRFHLVCLPCLQLRQANRNQRSLMEHGRNARTRDIFMHFADPSVTALVIRAFEADPTLTDAEYFAFYSLAGAIFVNYEDSFRQFRAGTLDAESWQSDKRTLEWLLSVPAYRAAWRAMRETIGEDTTGRSSTLSWRVPESSRQGTTPI